MQPGLAVVLVGEDPASQDLRAQSKGEQTKAAGMHSEEHRLPADAGQAEIVALVKKLNADKNIHGILVQLPLPNGLDPAPVIAAIDPDKDVDGLTITNAGRLASALPGLVPCTPAGCLMLIQDVLGDLKGKTAVVVGRFQPDGASHDGPALLLQADCTVTIAHSRTPGTRRASAARPTSWSPPSAVRKWSRPTGSSPARWSSTSASTASPRAIPKRRRRARPALSATWTSRKPRPWRGPSPRCPAAASAR